MARAIFYSGVLKHLAISRQRSAVSGQRSAYFIQKLFGVACPTALLNNGMISRLLWNGHLGGTGILPVSIYFRAGRMPTLLLFKRRFSNAWPTANG
ncbi:MULTISPECIES: hypothetical protein [Moorena]|uniref:Uncharacterized protein n=1 Tax=Moorena producens (strain JHB) TaxID=1454205 RepID=A0A9Q9STX4_MOOP1|nr:MULTISPECIES: hypothetical protein [Moorena]NEP67652.1 hypothetical protein [Moorena sp. SIO3A5]NER86982.1 hypothetical protein [Moorena sp. SIO3A2]NET67404.1 hypothetical protein [Moorena sp. SIO1G6]WAN69599.1 hypothetical protein BJP36_36520 [Moorena producens JHB]